MICPKCNQESINFDICPYCNYDFKTIPSELDKNVDINKLRAKLNIFYISVIVIGCIVLILLIINLFNKKKPIDDGPQYTNETTTTTAVEVDYVKSNPIKPVSLNELTIGSIKDNNTYYNAYVKGIRVMDQTESLSVLQAHGSTFELDPGFRYEGLVYQVNIKDNVSVNPVMNSIFYYADTGNDFINIDGNIIKPKVVSIYDGNNINKDETKEVIVVYETNTDNYSICLGYKSYNAACIKPLISVN